MVDLSRLNYDETVELECQMNLDPRKGNEYIRGNVVLPNGVGRETKICVFLPTKELEEEALAAGADMIGDDELLLSIGNGTILNEHKQYPFDVIIGSFFEHQWLWMRIIWIILPIYGTFVAVCRKCDVIRIRFPVLHGRQWMGDRDTMSAVSGSYRATFETKQ